MRPDREFLNGLTLLFAAMVIMTLLASLAYSWGWLG